ncbi:AAA family ATPase [Hoeflea sp.]|uniref:AAA family ATPase n=1 Tax=Hoeflea sp. TaxID=1940281 RepID=UPI003BAECA8B
MKRTINFGLTSIDGIAGRLENVRWKNDDSFTALCPAHDDHRNSLSVSVGEKGRLLFKCHAGCEFSEITEALGNPPSKAEEPKPQAVDDGLKPLKYARALKKRPDFKKLCGRRPAQVYEYRNAQDLLTGYVLRFADKSFHQVTPWQDVEGNVVWQVKDFAGPRPLYGLEELGDGDRPVLIVEGEKTADTARDLFPSHAVVSWHGGANAVHRSDWSVLRSCKVTIWPDADPPGKKAASTIAETLIKIGVKEAKLVKLPLGLPKGWDLADEIPDGMDIHELVENARPDGHDLSAYLLSAKTLAKLKIKPREMIIAPFLPTSSMMLVFATRGLGKTWFGITAAKAIALGRKFLGFEVPKARRVLFIDGEMPLSDLQERFKAIGADKVDNIDILASEIMHREFHPLNINDGKDRGLINAMLDRLVEDGRNPDLIILDNLSSLRMGAEENDNSALDDILGWLMGLRHKGYAMMLVHHASKTGDQRGASRLEDLLDTTIKLEKSKTASDMNACFDLTFTKTRGIRPDPDHMTLVLEENEDGTMDWQHSAFHTITPRDHTLHAIYLGPSEDGRKSFTKQKDLEGVLNLQAAAISKHLRFLRDNELVEPKVLKVTDKGKARLADVFPDETFY